MLKMHVKQFFHFSLVALVTCCLVTSAFGSYFGLGSIASSLNGLISSPATNVSKNIENKDDNVNIVKAEEVLDTKVTPSNADEKSEQVSLLMSCFNSTYLRDALASSLSIVEMCRLGSLGDNFAVCKDSVIKLLKANDYMMLRILASLYLGQISPALVDYKVIKEILSYALKYFTEEQGKLTSVDDAQKLSQVLTTVNEALTNADNKNTSFFGGYYNPLSYINADTLKSSCTRFISNKLGVEENTLNSYTEQLNKVYPSFFSKTLESLGLVKVESPVTK